MAIFDSWIHHAVATIAYARENHRPKAISIPSLMRMREERAVAYGSCSSDTSSVSHAAGLTVSGFFRVMINLAIKLQNNRITDTDDAYSTTGWSAIPIVMNGMVAIMAVDKASEYPSSFDIIFIFSN